MARPNHDENHLEKLRDHFAGHGAIPSLAEICEVIGFSSKGAASRLITRLKRGGYLRAERNGRLVPQGRFFARTLVGAVRAGSPQSGDPLPAEEFVVDHYLVDRPSDTFLVTVKGASMQDAGIYDQDIVVVVRKPDAKDGDIVVASVDGEMTVKELVLAGDKWELRPHNAEFRPIVAKEELKVLGVVTGVVRRLQGKSGKRRTYRMGDGL
jgi:repressor LexA